jgi:hypothetical protein
LIDYEKRKLKELIEYCATAPVTSISGLSTRVYNFCKHLAGKDLGVIPFRLGLDFKPGMNQE